MTLVWYWSEARRFGLLVADRDGSNKAIASAGDVRDETPAGVAIAERASECSDVNADACFFDESIGPDASKELLLGDHMTRPFKERQQNVTRATAEAHGRVVFEEQTLPRDQAKWPKNDDAVRGFLGWLFRHADSSFSRIPTRTQVRMPGAIYAKFVTCGLSFTLI